MRVIGTAAQIRPILQNIGSPPVVFYALDPSSNVFEVVVPAIFPGIVFRLLDAYSTAQLSSDVLGTFYRQVTDLQP